MPTITISITDAEAACVLAVTKETAQAYIERNARVHVEDCVRHVKAAAFAARGAPRDVALALDDEELEAVAAIKEAKVAAVAEAKAVADAARIAAESGE